LRNRGNLIDKIAGSSAGGRSSTRLVPYAYPLLALVFVTFACGGTGDPDQDAPVHSTTVALPSIPPESAEKTGLLVYRDPAAAQIVALNVSTGERRTVTGTIQASAYYVTAFDCTPDGRRIAYTTRVAGELTSVVAFGGEGVRSETVELPGGIVGMAWAPQGDRIAMSTVDGLENRLLILDVNSGTTTPLPPIGGYPGAPRWSPDGQRVVLDIIESGLSDIYVLDVAAPAPVKISTRHSAYTPDWSSDGHTIVFTAGDDRGGSSQLYAVDADGTNERKLTASETLKWSPRWSLDGSLISYTGLIITPVVSRLPTLTRNQAVWVASADGTNEVPVTDLRLDAQPLAWCLSGPWLE
jgi:hypothetical protein